MTDVWEQEEPEERLLSLGEIKRYYNEVYPFSFSVTDTGFPNVPNVFIPDAHQWACEQWGGSSARRWSQSRNGWRVRDDASWAYYMNVFYFKDPDHCVMFQLRWR